MPTTKGAAHALLLLAGLSTSLYGLKHLGDLDAVLPPTIKAPAEEKGGHTQFLTVCSLIVTAVTQAVGLVAVVLGHSSGRILKDVHTLGLALSLPLELVVALLFWPLYLLDRKLVRLSLPVSLSSSLSLSLSLPSFPQILPTHPYSSCPAYSPLALPPRTVQGAREQVVLTTRMIDNACRWSLPSPFPTPLIHRK